MIIFYFVKESNLSYSLQTHPLSYYILSGWFFPIGEKSQRSGITF